MRPGILPEHSFKHKGNHYLLFTLVRHENSTKVYHKGIAVLRFSSRRETPRSHVLYFRATSGHNVWCMRSVVSKELSRFRLPSSGRRRLLLKVPNYYMARWSCSNSELSDWFSLGRLADWFSLVFESRQMQNLQLKLEKKTLKYSHSSQTNYQD